MNVDDCPKKILILDDQPENRHALKSALVANNRILLEAGSLEHACAIAASHELALIFAGTEMSGLDGPECIEALRANTMVSTVPVILVAEATIQPATIQQAYAAGAADLIYRPINHSILRAKAAVFL